MCSDNQITLSQVANGWIVSLPAQREDPFEKSVKAGVQFAKQLQSDPMLQPREEPEEHNPDEIKLEPDRTTHVFLSTKDMLAFLNYHLQQQ